MTLPTFSTSFNTFGYNEWSAGGGGGSGYLKDTLTDKGFYCYYGCGGENTVETGNKGEHIVNYANTGAGYARITYNTISFNNYLKSLTSNVGTWENEFKPTRNNYQVNVDMYTQSITFDGELSDSKADVIGLGEYELEIGYNYVTIYVTAGDWLPCW